MAIGNSGVQVSKGDGTVSSKISTNGSATVTVGSTDGVYAISGLSDKDTLTIDEKVYTYTANGTTYRLLDDSLVIDNYYGGEDATPTDGQW